MINGEDFFGSTPKINEIYIQYAYIDAKGIVISLANMKLTIDEVLEELDSSSFTRYDLIEGINYVETHDHRTLIDIFGTDKRQISFVDGNEAVWLQIVHKLHKYRKVSYEDRINIWADFRHYCKNELPSEEYKYERRTEHYSYM